MVTQEKLLRLRQVITENLRVQRDGAPIDYVDVGTALQDACSKQNHAIFARRGCGKTLLLHHSSRALQKDVKSVYLNCEDFKRHSFPNVLIEILTALFRELDQNLRGWFGRKKKSKEIIKNIIQELARLHQAADIHDEEVTRKKLAETETGINGSAGAEIDHLRLGLATKDHAKERQEVERSSRVHREKLQELDSWLPTLKESIRTFFKLSNSTSALLVQIDDLYPSAVELRRDGRCLVTRLCCRCGCDNRLFGRRSREAWSAARRAGSCL